MKMTSLTPHQVEALNYKNHISLTANAGSGKTFVLSKRYLEIALNENVSLRNIAAITFTDKAAGELYKKIVNQVDEKIAEVLESGGSPQLIQKLENIRRQLVSASISTIHSFCIDILREFPVEAGIDANFNPIDEQLSSELIEMSVDEVIRKSLMDEKDNSELKYLIRILASKRSFSIQLASLIKNRKNISGIDSKIYNKSEKEIAEYFFDSFLKYSQRILAERKDEILNDLKIINDQILFEKPRNKTALKIRNLISSTLIETEIIKLLNNLREICETTLTKKSEFPKKYLTEEIREAYQNEADSIAAYFKELRKIIEFDLNHDETELELARFGKAVLKYFNKVLHKYEEKKREHSYLDFEDILLLTRKVLENKAVRQELTKKFKFIMVDEYQDTNEIQYEIFLPILEYLQKGNLFIVGDEKQSIYMFRDAELEIFLQTQNQIKETSGNESLRTLPESFRMAPSICLFTNKLFENLFSLPNDIYNEVYYSEIICARDENADSKIEFLLAEEDEDNNNYEAELVAGKILKLIKKSKPEEKIRWKDIGILCRKRKSFAELEKVFVKYKIPFVIVGGKGFYQKQIIYDFFNYFSFLLDKNNDTALIGILRSPFFSISDTDIFEISLLREKSFWEKLKKFSGENKKYENVVGTLEENLSFSKSSDIIGLLRKMLDESDMLAVLSSKANGIQETANVEKLIRLTINFCSRDFITLYDYVDFLKDSIEKTEDEAQAAVTDESDSVNIMTLHQAKGLEFPVVFLYNSHEALKHKPIKSKEIYVDKNFGLLAKVPLNQNYLSDYESAPIIAISDYVSNKKNIAELKRLLYVGITRAKNYLFISAGWQKDYNYNPASFIGLIQEGLSIDFNSQEFKIEGNLKFLKNTGNVFHNINEKIEIEIPITKNIEFESSEMLELISDQRENKIKSRKNLLLNEIKDAPKGEIISATKVAVFTQCPVKYQLTYELGLSPLFGKHKLYLNENRKLKNHYEFSEKENELIIENPDEAFDGIKNFSDVKGRIIHKILQKELRYEEININLENFIKEELNITGIDSLEINKFKEDTLNDLKLFYNSDIFEKLRFLKNYKNEYEIYVQENDYYLYGIIDKIIFISGSNKILIIDYKTDDIDEEEIEERSKSYMTQLKFYSYIVSKLFQDFNEFELRLIFIKYPEKVISERINRGSELENLQKKIKNIALDIRNQNFKKNLSHCKKCFFAIRNNCIKN